MYVPPRMFINDPRGELAAISIHTQIRFRKRVYCINPYGLHGLPQHRINPLDILKPDSPTLHADTTLFMIELIVMSGSANASFFELGGRKLGRAVTLHYVHRNGGITLPELYEAINAIQDPARWPDIGNEMLASPIQEVVNAAIEIETKRHEAPKEFSGIMGEIIQALSFLSDPYIYSLLSASDFSLEAPCLHDCNVYNMIPAEYAEQLAPMTRLIMSAAMLYKQRRPDAPRVLFLIDEAATLKRSEFLLRGYTFGRGFGIRMISIWQNPGQIVANFGQGSLQAFVGSSQVRLYFGVRDIEIAKLVSEMIGTQTLEYNATLDQQKARTAKMQIVAQMIKGCDLVEASLNFQLHNYAENFRTEQARVLMMPDEVLRLREDEAILHISGLNLKPILANKYAYFSRREMAGNYFPNPYHPPADKVKIATFFGSRWRKVITERVPEAFAQYPQYQSGYWSFIEGYRPI